MRIQDTIAEMTQLMGLINPAKPSLLVAQIGALWRAWSHTSTELGRGLHDCKRLITGNWSCEECCWATPTVSSVTSPQRQFTVGSVILPGQHRILFQIAKWSLVRQPQVLRWETTREPVVPNVFLFLSEGGCLFFFYIMFPCSVSVESCVAIKNIKFLWFIKK